MKKKYIQPEQHTHRIIATAPLLFRSSSSKPELVDEEYEEGDPTY